jgi:uncharacterized protein YndB with AHSA1/START domain
MTERSVIHDTFVIERTYPAGPSRVFAAFASREAKDAWADTGDIAVAEPATGPAEFDFRVGGHERFRTSTRASGTPTTLSTTTSRPASGSSTATRCTPMARASNA